MTYALVQNGVVIAYPYDPSNFKPIPYQDYTSEGVYWVWPTGIDNPDPENLKAVELPPRYNSELRQWEESWQLVEKTEEDRRLESYNPSAFLQAMFSSSSFESWLNNFNNFRQAGFLDAATNAKMDTNWTVVQALYEGMATAIPPAPEAVASWQALADANSIPLVF